MYTKEFSWLYILLTMNNKSHKIFHWTLSLSVWFRLPTVAGDGLSFTWDQLEGNY